MVPQPPGGVNTAWPAPPARCHRDRNDKTPREADRRLGGGGGGDGDTVTPQGTLTTSQLRSLLREMTTSEGLTRYPSSLKEKSFCPQVMFMKYLGDATPSRGCHPPRAAGDSHRRRRPPRSPVEVVVHLGDVGSPAVVVELGDEAVVAQQRLGALGHDGHAVVHAVLQVVAPTG